MPRSLFEHQIVSNSYLSIIEGDIFGVKRLQSILYRISLLHDGCESYAILLVSAVPGESSSLPFTQVSSRAWFCCCYLNVGGLIVGCWLGYSRFQLQKLDQKIGWPTDLGAGMVNKLDF
ncbi:MAG: hypothetical protein EZS28_034875 [Streblomastix strix]|uniref:Uncharacterized protein n=1 Tax=Streblomastix strix TaxID=222440 RepID=A0A5J4UFP7_9EUKA|nr:MAG: hypothetical protein EZS28_034875 [Streblomastix strix]